MRRSTSGAAGSGLGTTIKYLRSAAGIGLGTTIKLLPGTNFAESPCIIAAFVENSDTHTGARPSICVNVLGPSLLAVLFYFCPLEGGGL
jgi:hypothetical protein